MNKSIEFVKKRVSSDAFTGFGNIKDKQNHVIPYTKIVKYNELKNTFCFGNKTIKARFKYNPYADFDYLVAQSCYCDGTLSLAFALCDKIVERIFTGKSCYEPKKPKDLYKRPEDYEILFELGDFVFVEEYEKQFATRDKPWINSKFTVILPVKCDFFERNRSDKYE